jgi:hypothetical protein
VGRLKSVLAAGRIGHHARPAGDGAFLLAVSTVPVVPGTSRSAVGTTRRARPARRSKSFAHDRRYRLLDGEDPDSAACGGWPNRSV